MPFDEKGNFTPAPPADLAAAKRIFEELYRLVLSEHDKAAMKLYRRHMTDLERWQREADDVLRFHTGNTDGDLTTWKERNPNELPHETARRLRREATAMQPHGCP